jgi:hypothetical protein
MIKAIVCRVGTDPVVEEIDRSLESLQKLVGGYLERIPLEVQVDVWCNEDGKLWELEENRWVDSAKGPVLLLGDFVILSRNSAGEHIDLSNEEIERWLPRLKKWPISHYSAK